MNRSNLHSSWAWRLPTLLQAGFPAIAMVLVLFLPESPRWLVANDKTEEALAVLAKYHGEGDVNAPIVQLQYQQIMEEHHNNNPGRWWDYRELVATRSARHRIILVIAVAFFGQWSGKSNKYHSCVSSSNTDLTPGNNVVSYFMVSTRILKSQMHLSSSSSRSQRHTNS